GLRPGVGGRHVGEGPGGRELRRPREAPRAAGSDSLTTALHTRPTQDRMDRFYRLVRASARFWLWFFFKSVDPRHPERVPDAGPVLLRINHPNNLIDSVLVGATVRLEVHYLAPAALFSHQPLAPFPSA